MLVDLDELVAECPDPRSRKYIREAVQCYKAGAYRSSVVATWIAVAFDLVDKIREVGATGDRAAQEAIEKFDQARERHDVTVALAFEKNLLELARDKFEFISQIEFIDLSRLVDDRNRCAHPSHVSATEVFEASPELARLHIVNATRYVLSKPPAQGKAALDRVLADLDSRFFPSKPEDVKVFLESGPLAKPRESLLRNYLNVLIKDLIKLHDISYERSSRSQNALFVLQEMHPEPWKRLMPEILRSVIATLQDDRQLMHATRFLGRESGAPVWAYLGEADRLRFIAFVQNYPGDSIDDLEWLLSHDLPLQEAAIDRISHASEADIMGGMWFFSATPVLDRMLAFYRWKQNFADANEFAKRLRVHLMDSSDPDRHLRALIDAAARNNQISGSNQFPSLLREFVEKKDLDKPAVDQLLIAAGLEPIAW
ncbi:hypothetical protein K788_0006451 [Paraburkholderia caribensis MBA4]|uniref:Uncharacterized protein n=1 Tax=Paraburkholderia caribensis MBA4 TaxID=1323664 RepID=A0A0P0RBX8_9BURK|nr:hypothetical protein [Paraburkholderia caribensis]ALL65772.1 hypothetical protein K788_0006451 [Paraburkholderia caribensis MBA4]